MFLKEYTGGSSAEGFRSRASGALGFGTVGVCGLWGTLGFGLAVAIFDCLHRDCTLV